MLKYEKVSGFIMKISIIVAVAENNVIGKKGSIPWHLPEDLKHFKKITSGHHVIMGQTTFESIGRPLPKRVSVVLTKDRNFESSSCIITHSLIEALKTAEKAGENEVFFIGGGSVYEQALPLASKLYLTRVHARINGDVFFPKIDPTVWKLVLCETHQKDPENPYAFDFCIYQKRV